MKNLFKFVFVCGLFLSSFAFGQDFSKMKKDPVFIEYLKGEVSVMSRTKVENLEKILRIIKVEKISDKDKTELAKLFGFENVDDYIRFIEKQNVSLNKLNEVYQFNKIDANQLASKVLSSPEILPILSPIDPPLEETNGVCRDNCARSGRNCRIITTAFAVVAHAGCASTDVILIGLVCHAAVTVGAIAQLDDCNLTQSTCVSNCKD